LYRDEIKGGGRPSDRPPLDYYYNLQPTLIYLAITFASWQAASFASLHRTGYPLRSTDDKADHAHLSTRTNASTYQSLVCAGGNKMKGQHTAGAGIENGRDDAM
jgi:hypothetical protein